MRHMHTSILSRHLATRGNNKIMRSPLPHISSSKEILPVFPLPNSKQINHPFSNHTSTQRQITSTMPPCNTHAHNTHHLFNSTHICTTLSPLVLWKDPAGVTAMLASWTQKLAGGPQSGRSDSPPPTNSSSPAL